MYFLFSGEGPTDLGVCRDGDNCESDKFESGPMSIIVDQIVERQHGYSLLETGCCGYVSKHQLAFNASKLKSAKKGIRLPGKKRAKETRYFFDNARVLATIANMKQKKLDDDVVAVLFRDADTASAGRGVWQEKRQSMLDGFAEEDFAKGVPMIPKPISEAWLLCALKKKPYKKCAALEDRSGSDKSPKPIKDELERLLGRPAARRYLCDIVTGPKFDIDKIDMPSFSAFRNRLEEVL